jgi:hypothetical protein
MWMERDGSRKRRRSGLEGAQRWGRGDERGSGPAEVTKMSTRVRMLAEMLARMLRVGW